MERKKWFLWANGRSVDYSDLRYLSSFSGLSASGGVMRADGFKIRIFQVAVSVRDHCSSWVLRAFQGERRKVLSNPPIEAFLGGFRLAEKWISEGAFLLLNIVQYVIMSIFIYLGLGD